MTAAVFSAKEILFSNHKTGVFMIKLFIRLSDKKERNRREFLSNCSGIFGIICNIILCIVKFIVGQITNSISITADAVNNLSDAGSNIVTIVGTKISVKPVDEEHPFGHGRVEYISAMIVSFFVFIMGFELGKNSIEKIIEPQEVQFSILSVILLCLTIAVKLYMSYINARLYKITDNINLKAVKQDSFNDCIATTATIAAMIISSTTKLSIADGIIGLCVSVFIFISGIKLLKDITSKILGEAPSRELVEEIEKIISEEKDILGTHDLIIHDYGTDRRIASVHAEVSSSMDIVEIHNVIDRVEKRILKELRVVMCIHMDPIITDDEEINEYKQLLKKVINEYNDKFTFHEFELIKRLDKINIMFELVVPYKQDESNTDIIIGLNKKIKEYNSDINLIITIEHSYV